MKRILLWTANLLFLMTLSSTYAAPGGEQLQAISLAELSHVTAGICTTCPPPPRMDPVGDGWELWNSFTSTPVETGRTLLQALVNNSSVAQTSSVSYNDQCQYRITGGSTSIGTSLGLSINRTYSCARTRTVPLTVPPRSSITLYAVSMAYYVTDHYRQVIYYSDGQVERTGATEVVRTEHRYTALDFVEH